MAALVKRVDYSPPVCLDLLIGRQAELAQLRDAISTTRLLTLTGPAGVGKSRLAAELVRQIAKRYSEVSWLDGKDIPSETSALDRRRKHWNGNVSREYRVEERGAARNRLLIVDNCDHADVDVARAVYEILCGVPEITILATSRSPLGLRGEVASAVQPMEIWVEESSCSSAIQLFANRAEAAAGYQTFSKSDLQVVAEICRHVDGIPLAIEVAASQMGAAPAAEVLKLVSGPEFLDLPLPADHDQFRSFRQIQESSYERLPPDEQVALRALAVFSGSFDLAAARSLISHQHPSVRAATTINALVKRSLLKRVDTGEDGSARYEVYELARRFVAGLLRPEERNGAAGRLAHQFLSLAETAAPLLEGPDAAVWVRKLRRDEHNFLSAFEWLLKQEPRAALRLAIALAPFHASRNQFATGRAQLASALAGADESLLRATGKYWMGHLAMFQRDDAGALASFRAALNSTQNGADDGLASRCYQGLATIYQFTGDLDKAQDLAEKAVAYATKASDALAGAAAVNRIGYLAYLRRDYPRAQALMLKALRMSQKARSIRRGAIALTNLGELAVSCNQLQLAHKFLRDAEVIWRQIGDDYASASNLEAIAYLYLRRGRLSECARSLSKIGVAYRRIGHEIPTDVLEIAAMLAEAKGQHSRALTLGAASAVFRGRGGMRALAEDPATYNRCLAIARNKMGRKASLEAETEGRALTFAEAITLACEEDAADGAVVNHTSVLSPREYQVARGVACGSSNRDIANEFGISPSTVEVHLENIRRKLGFRSRTQVAVWFATGARNGQVSV